tara:strand:- start:140 stop:526 length:387 start_codon:yes stop_codon:yes gene_type:complete
MKNSIRMTQQGGVQYTFDNGYTLSIGCGTSHYSSNQDKDDAYGVCTEVEVAIMNPAGGWVALEYDVAGWVKAGNIPSLMRAVENKDWEQCALLCGQEEYDHSKNRRDEDPTSDQSQAGGYYAELDEYA